MNILMLTLLDFNTLHEQRFWGILRMQKIT